MHDGDIGDTMVVHDRMHRVEPPPIVRTETRYFPVYGSHQMYKILNNKRT